MDTQIESINDPHALLAEVRKVREHVASEGERILSRWRPKLQRDDFDAGSTNLAHYLALRELDLRSLQRVLISWGVSGLGRSESRVLPTLDAVLANLALICGDQDAVQLRPSFDDFYQGSSGLKAQTNKLFGTASDGRETRILVTMQPKKCKDLDYIRVLFNAGMNMARINCAHDSVGVWLAAIENIRTVAAERGVRCPIFMDLQGPKIRTRSVITPAKSNKVKGGNRIFLTFDEPKRSSEFDFQTSCATPDVLRQVGLGAVVSIKDGLIRGQVDEVREEGLVVSVTRTPPDGQPLENEKGINFPSTALTVSPLTEQDLKDLDFVAEHADIVAYSFVQRREDIAWLQRELLARRPDRAPMAIVAKIETQLSFTNLPELIVQAAGANPFGVMIARGDLAVEIGYERLSEVQEEILWVCEAAHVPVIWATQVLEGLVKRGMPSRGEFTDAAMGNRAECVMLNKGRYIDEGIAVLDNVLCRMERHQVKKSPQLRALSAWAGMH